jgi:hypothetical protein
MAACRYCGEVLEDDEVHQCTWRDLAWRLARPAIAMLLGVMCSLAALYLLDLVYFDGDPSYTSVALGTLAGMVIGYGVADVTSR